MQGFATQPATLALRTKRVPSVSAEENAHVQLVLLPLQIFEKATNSLKILVALDQPSPRLRSQPIVRNIQRNTLGPCRPLHLVVKHSVPRLGPGLHCPLSKTFVLVRNNQVQVEINGVAKSLAAGAGAVRIIEGKETWLGRLEYDLAPLALKPFAEDQAFRLL